MARQYEVYIAQSSAGILIGTLASIVTVTVLLYMIQHDMIAPDLFH
jgi:hypothetical protein